MNERRYYEYRYRQYFSIISDWNNRGHDYALAIVVSTWGSSPRQAGSFMAIREDGYIEGLLQGDASNFGHSFCH